MPRIVGSDSDIIRRMFLEASEAMGCTALYHELKVKTSRDLYNDPTSLYEEPLVLEVLFDENPKVKMMKSLGWYNEDEEIRPLLIYLPIYKNQQRDLINVMEECLVEIVYFGINKTAIFKISSKRLDSLYGNYWVCKCVPERKVQFTYDPSDGYDFLDINKPIIRTLVYTDQASSSSDLVEFERQHTDEANSNSTINLGADSSSSDSVVAVESGNMGISAEDTAALEFYFGDSLAEVPVNDEALVDSMMNDLMGETSFSDEAIGESNLQVGIPSSDDVVGESTTSNLESEDLKVDELSGDDYSSLVMGG